MVLSQAGEAAAVPAGTDKELEAPPGLEDDAGTGQPCLHPAAPGMEAVGAEECRVCGCCSGSPWPRCCGAPGEEGGRGSGWGWWQGGSVLLAGLPARGVTLPPGQRKRKRPRGPRLAPHRTWQPAGARGERLRPHPLLPLPAACRSGAATGVGVRFLL